MIQRIQTLYLLAATILMALVYFMPLMTFGTIEGLATVYTYKMVDGLGIVEATPWYLSALTLMAMVLPFGTIFRYKKRLTQIRWCAVELVLLVGVVLMEAFYGYRFYQLFADLSPELLAASYKVTLLFPLVSMLFVWLAMRAIFRDEMLVRAADRIR